MAKISFSIFIDSLHSELALGFCLDTPPYIFYINSFKQDLLTPLCLISSLKLCFLSGFSLSFAVHIFLIVYLSLFFLSLYAMELINGPFRPHQEELLGFISRYDAVRSDNYLSYIQNIVWFWPGFFGRYRLGCKPKGVYKTKQLVEEFEGLSNGTHAGFSGVLKCTQVRNHQGRRQLKARDLIFFFSSVYIII